ncbi:MAG TPA: hypothetical protein V6C65_33720 [Allocoleopsis sp.]
MAVVSLVQADTAPFQQVDRWDYFHNVLTFLCNWAKLHGSSFAIVSDWGPHLHSDSRLDSGRSRSSSPEQTQSCEQERG